MKKLFLLISILSLGLFSCQNKSENNSVIVAYVSSGDPVMPNPELMTHINYAFGTVKNTFDGVNIQKENRLRDIVGLKDKNPKLKVCLSIGGWTAGNFSEMAATDETRLSFAKDCKRIVDEFNLDGIDIDWEYPSSSEAGISSSPDDIDNFTLLMRDIRKEIGNDKLLTLATIARAEYIDFKAIDKYIDFVNIMAYDLGRPPYHHATLYRSDKTKGVSCEEAVDLHIKAGMSPKKLNLGMPFYGHAAAPLPDFVDYKDIVKMKDQYVEKWDDVAKVPYLEDKEGNYIMTYENERSIKEKCAFIKQKGLLGAMYWEYKCDTPSASLANTVANEIIK